MKNVNVAQARAEYRAWLAFSQAVKNVAGTDGAKHPRACSCDDAGCLLYRTARAWGVALIAQERGGR